MIRSILAKCWLVFAVVTILMAAFMTIARLLLPMASDYRKEIEGWISVSIGQPVEIGSIESEWHGLGPRLDIIDVKVFDDQHDRLLVRFKQARIGIDLIASLLRARFELGNFTVVGANILVTKLPDGSITVQGLSLGQSDTSSPESNRLLQWLLAQESLAIESTEVLWKDLADDKQLQFSSVNLDLRNDGSRHQFDGSATLPPSLGRRISFAIDLKGDPLVPGGWNGRAYINGGGLHLDTLLKTREIAGMHIEHGIAEVRLWSDWKNARLVKLEGILSSFGLEASSVGAKTAESSDDKPQPGGASAKSFKVDTLSGKFAWQNQQDGWSLAINNFVLGREGRVWPASELSLGIGGEGWEQHIEARASYLNMEDVRDLLLTTNQPDPKLRKALLSMRPRADLYNSYLAVLTGGGDDTNINISSRFENLEVRPWGKLPGIEGLAGTVKGSGQSGSIEFTSSAAQVVLQPMFRQPISISKLDGLVTWRHQQGHILLASNGLDISNQDLQLNAGMNIEIPDDGSAPFVGLDVNFSGLPGSVAHTSQYLPVTLIPHAVRWLDKAIVSGTVSDGKFIFNGRVDQFPFDHGNHKGDNEGDQGAGKFEVRFNVTDGILDYAEGWPRLEEIEAEVRFSGSSMEINAIAGKSFDTKITDVHARIPDLHTKPAELEIQGKAHGPTEDALRYINNSPLAHKFGRYLKTASATGKSRLDLKLVKLLAKGEPVKVNGDLTLIDSGLQLPDSKVDITDIDGELGFTESTLSAENINAQLLGLQSTVDVSTRREEQVTATYFTAQGAADEAAIARLLEIPEQKIFSGETHWNARLRIPRISEAVADETVVSTLHIESDLKGLKIDLPEPLKKDQAESRKLVIETGLPRSLDKLVELKLGNILSANLDVDDQMHIERGEIHLGPGIAPFPERDGLHVSGKWPQLSLDNWLPLIESEKIASGLSTAAVVNHVDININKLMAFDRPYHHVKVVAERMPQMWQVTVDSKEMKGEIQVPADPQKRLVMNLDYLHLTKLKTTQAGDHIDPRKVPVMKISSKVFTYNGIDFGSLDLTASRHPAGIHLDNLKLTSPTNNVDARGDWLSVDGEHYSSFNITFTSADLGDTLDNWGYAGNINEGKCTFNIVARWPGPPTSFALERLDGNLHLKITDGRMLDIDPGAGRIFGLISLQALPRRLSLDFSDLFQKGFTFDRIEGDFVLKGGNATTENLVMEGPAARLGAQGTIGLAARDYDQIVTVTPHVSSSLPVAGAVVGGMGVGAAILLAQKLLEPEIDKATQIKYSITGPWDNPVIKRINVKHPVAQESNNQGK